MTTNALNNIKSTKIVQDLRANSPGLYNYVEQHCQFVSPELDCIEDFFSEYTDHSSKHSLAIIRLADMLLNNIDLSPWEIAVFILSAFHHDIGMLFLQEEHNETFRSMAFKRKKPYLEDIIISSNQLKKAEKNIVEKYIKLEWIRRQHHERSYKWILRNYPDENIKSFFNNDIYLWQAAAHVCRGHCLEIKYIKDKPYTTKYPIGSGITIDIIFLTALLRLADICHFSRDRALPYIRNSIDFYSQKSQKIWLQYAEISDTLPNKENGVIEIHANCKSASIHRAIIDSAKNIEWELKNIHHLIHESHCSNNFMWKFVDTTNVIEDVNSNYLYNDIHFKLDSTRIADLLMGSRLYGNKMFALRECIQNCVDANTVFQNKDNSIKNYIIIKYTSITPEATLEIFDNGTGMDLEIVENYLFSIGSNSFWFTERCFSDWGMVKKTSPIISSHGIGFLSSFMIANKIEVFSKYQNREPVHLEIDSYKTGAIQKKTTFKEFPKIPTSSLKLTSPWNQDHGTCVRLHLKDLLTKKDLVSFLSEHIPRIAFPIYLSYNDEFIKLKNIWHYTNGRYFDEKEPTLKALIEAYYMQRPRDFYDNPPEDDSLNAKTFHRTCIKGSVYPKWSDDGYGRAYDRITQNGILISEGSDFIRRSELFKKKDKYNAQLIPFNFDIDVSGEFMFDLDAERTHIIDNDSNKNIRTQISHILFDEYLKKIGKIESPYYFTCGNFYYHGANNIHIEDQNRRLCFHGTLKSFFSIQNTATLSTSFDLSPILKSKIYGYLSNVKSEFCSVKDIELESNEVVIFLPHSLPIRNQYSEPDLLAELQKWYAEKIQSISLRLTTSRSLLLLPGFPNSFLLPIASKFNFTIEKVTNYYKLIKLELKKKIDFSIDSTELLGLSSLKAENLDHILAHVSGDFKLH